MFDVVIIGGGVAGLVLARLLAKRGTTCAVIEAGTDRAVGDWRKGLWRDNERDFVETDTDYPYKTEYSWVKALGGSALAWEGYCLRMNEADFLMRTRNGVGFDWPIGYGDLEPYYSHAERFLGVAGKADNPFDSLRTSDFPLPEFEFGPYELGIIERCGSLGLAWHHVPQARNSIAYGKRSACNFIGTCNYCPTGARWTPIETLVPRLKKMETVKIFKDTTCVKLETDRAGLVVRTHLISQQKGAWSLEAKRFVIAAGAVETSRLLLLSRVKTCPNGIGNSNDLVGRFYMDHPIFRVRAETDWRRHEQLQTNILASSHNYRHYDRETFSTGFLVNMNSRIPPPNIYIAAHFEMLPEFENHIALSSRKRDCFGSPVASIQIRTDNRWLSNTERRIKMAIGEIARAAAGKKLQFDPLQLWGCHPMGGCRMGFSATDSVVDKNLRCWESGNLYILSNAVFPTSSAVNPTLTLVALAFRLADTFAAGSADPAIVDTYEDILQ